MSSGVVAHEDCISTYSELKQGKKLKYIIFKLSDDRTQIVVEDSSTNPDWEEFRTKLVDSKSKNKAGVDGMGCRYAVYDFNYELENGEGQRNKIAFISWSPDDAPVQTKMIYSSSKDALKNALSGISDEHQANDPGELEENEVLQKVSKGTAKSV